MPAQQIECRVRKTVYYAHLPVDFLGYTHVMLISGFPLTLYSADQSRELDRLAIEQTELSAYELMYRAAESAYRVLRQQWPESRQLLVVCGPGNNGGDGYLLAALAQSDGKQVTVLVAGGEPHSDEAQRAAGQWYDCNAETLHGDQLADALSSADVVVDALTGTGLRRDLDGEWAELVSQINRSGLPVLAVDIPSGLDADSGAIRGIAIQASVTITFICLKKGQLTASGPDYCGQLILDDLDIPARIYEQVKSDCQLIDGQYVRKLLPPRKQASHKGSYGHVLIIGGDHGMAGAVALAAEAAMRTGAGLVSIATRKSHSLLMNTRCPEVMCHGIDTPEQLQPLLRRADVVAIGPGLGESEWAKSLLTEVIATQLYLIVDADALKLLKGIAVKRGRWILTPHPGEAAVLLGSTSGVIQQDRFAALASICERYQCVTVLKGNGTLVQAVADNRVSVCQQGNPGMASAGMGDVLTGVIAALVAQGLSLPEAARTGVYLHASAADRAAGTGGERGMMASDLFCFLRQQANPDQDLTG